MCSMPVSIIHCQSVLNLDRCFDGWSLREEALEMLQKLLNNKYGLDCIFLIRFCSEHYDLGASETWESRGNFLQLWRPIQRECAS